MHLSCLSKKYSIHLLKISPLLFEEISIAKEWLRQREIFHSFCQADCERGRLCLHAIFSRFASTLQWLFGPGVQGSHKLFSPSWTNIPRWGICWFNRIRKIARFDFKNSRNNSQRDTRLICTQYLHRYCQKPAHGKNCFGLSQTKRHVVDRAR